MSPVPSCHLLKQLRSLMVSSSAGNLSAYIIPSSDAHQNEYLASYDLRRDFISKFTGSAGTAIVTMDKAALWTDGRYHLQASQELDLNHWILMKAGLPTTPTTGEWLSDCLKSGSKVGVDPRLFSHESWDRLSKELKPKEISLVGVRENLVDLIWEDKACLEPTDKDRPSRPQNKLIVLSMDITGKEWFDKVAELRDEMRKKQAGSIVLTALDDIAWLLNLRGSDIDCNPVFFAYCIVTKSDVCLFIDQEKLTPEVEQSINAVHGSQFLGNTSDSKRVVILPYDNIMEFISKSLLSNLEDDEFVWLTASSSEAVHSLVPKKKKLLAASPVTKAKARKNEVEVRNMKNCHIRDAAALCEYLAWLEKTIETEPEGHDSLKEVSAADYLESCRKQQAHFMGLSFPTISSSGPNGAIIHYKPARETQRDISKRELYLVDSGGQYLDGTTDVTRTMHFGTPSAKERECFTLVLKGHIQLGKAVFPRLTKAFQLDCYARQFLWARGLDYLHGTGHGVGMFLNVHEGPSAISPNPSPNDPGLEVGHILSNEPGYYEDGAFGIRIENLVVIQPAETPYNFNQKGYLKFENLTLVPYQSKMIDLSMLSQDEIDYLNQYHADCLKFVGDHLDKTGKHEVKNWLIKQTEKLVKP